MIGEGGLNLRCLCWK